MQAPDDLKYTESHEWIRSEGEIVESVKTVSDILAPVSGEIRDVNSALGSHPESVNKDPYGEGWLFKISLANTDEITSL